MKKCTLLLTLLIASMGFSQRVLQDFENGGIGALFGGASAALVQDPDPQTGVDRGQVAMLTSSGSQIWQGVNLNLLTNSILTTDRSITIDAYSLVPLTFAPKAVEGLVGAPDSVSTATHTGTGWETITVTFDKGLDNTIAASGTYANIAIHYLWNPSSNNFLNPVVNRVVYIDKIMGIGVAPVAYTAPTNAASTPIARDAWDVRSIYSNAYTAIGLSNFDSGWCGAGSVSQVMIDGNATQAYRGNSCQGIEFSATDVTAFTNLHVDLYIASEMDMTGAFFKIKLVEVGGSELELNFNSGSTPALVAGQWNSVDVAVDLSNFDLLSQLGILSNFRNSVWYDNLYLWKASTAGLDDQSLNSVQMYPNPANGIVKFSTLSNQDLQVSVYDLLGKQVIPAHTVESELNISSLNPGLYFVNMVQDKNTATKKLLVK